jgi:hypothetical protein
VETKPDPKAKAKADPKAKAKPEEVKQAEQLSAVQEAAQVQAQAKAGASTKEVLDVDVTDENEMKEAIEAELKASVEHLKDLEKDLAKRYTDAFRQDAGIASKLQSEGLLIKAQYPVGPSTLVVDESVMNNAGLLVPISVSKHQDERIEINRGTLWKFKDLSTTSRPEEPGYLKPTGQ